MTQNSKFSATAPLAGYIFQCRLALLRALQMSKKKANGSISIEKFDDVAFEDDDYSKCLIQAKHHIKPKALNDLSTEVWKTLRIWIEQLDQGLVQTGSTKFLLITTATAEPKSAMELLRVGAAEIDHLAAFELLTKAANKSKNQSTEKARSAFLALSKEKALALFAQIEIIDQHPNLIDVMSEIEGEILLTAPSNVEQAASYLEGWWLGEVGERLVNDGNAAIPVQNVVKKANEIGKMFSEDTLPIDDPNSLGIKEYSTDDEAELFVRQMRVIGLMDRTIKRGVHDFYRAYAQRSKWARENLILDGEAQKYDQKIKDHWERKFDSELVEVDMNNEIEKEAAGRCVFNWASQASYGFRNVVETWITSGSFHSLSDRLEVGWHPEFEELFKKDED